MLVVQHQHQWYKNQHRFLTKISDRILAGHGCTPAILQTELKLSFK